MLPATAALQRPSLRPGPFLSQGPVYSRGPRRLVSEPEAERNAGPASNESGTAPEECRMTRLASSRSGENPPYGMNQGVEKMSARSDGHLPRCSKGQTQRKPLVQTSAPPLYSSAFSRRVRFYWSNRCHEHTNGFQDECANRV